MFDKLQQLQKMRELQKRLEQERAEGEAQGTRVVLNGSFEMLELQLNPELSRERQEHAVKDAYAAAKKQVQQKLASQLGGLM